MMANNNATTSTSTPQPQQPKSSTDGSNNSFIAYKPSYVLTETEIHRRLSEVVNELQETIRIPAAICQRLLQQARWDHDQAVLNFFANDGKLEPALYGAYDPADPTEDDPVKKFSLASGHCELCDADDIPLRALNCRHFFCIDCWCHFLKTKVMDETTIQITCPAFDCNVLLDRTTALQMITEPEMHRLYTRLEVKNYLMSNRIEMQQCPSTGCPNIVQSSMIQSRRYTCSCGTIFCSECGNPWHEPINCELLRLWLKRCDDDLGSLAWIRRFTKPCPRCETPIEKNRGCNHITCRGCRYQFCWVCLGAWSLHSRDQFFACNRFNGNAPNANNNNRPDPDAPQGNRPPERTELDRFFFYATRYENHARSQLLERQQFRQQSKGWRQAYQDRTGQHESNFLPAAIDALAWARLLLQFSYPFAYFLNRLYDTSRHFEDRQKQLETGVEQLSALLEQGNNIGGSPGMEMDALTKLKTEITKVTRQLKRDGVLLLRYAYQSEWHFSAELAPGLESGIMPEQERETSNDADDDDEATTSADVRKKTHEMEGTATSSQAGNSSHDEGIDLEEFDFAQ